MDNTCWPHVIHMVIRVGCTAVSMDYEQQYIRQTTLYQELYRVFLCYSIQELFHCLTLRALNHNKNADEKDQGSCHRSQRRFYAQKRKIYPLSRVEREEVQEFVKNQLRKGYIRLSKSPQTSLVFFVLKKDGKKRMVQDY